MLFSEPKIPQSARRIGDLERALGFSALQRAENSSIAGAASLGAALIDVSVLFSEPKIPQFRQMCVSRSTAPVSVLFSEPKIPQSTAALCRAAPPRVSVLFSEPKIPQSASAAALRAVKRRFSALQRAENSSILVAPVTAIPQPTFQCSSASRKFLNLARFGRV